MTKQYLKFSNFIKCTGLKPKAAQHILRLPNVLSGMPKAGSKGIHREFNLAQAFRLALCTHLVKASIAPQTAGKIVAFCEKQVGPVRTRQTKQGTRTWATNSPHERRFVPDPTPWILTIDDCRYCRLWNDSKWPDIWHVVDEDDFLDIETGRRECDKLLGEVRYVFNVSDIELRLWKELKID